MGDATPGATWPGGGTARWPARVRAGSVAAALVVLVGAAATAGVQGAAGGVWATARATVRATVQASPPASATEAAARSGVAGRSGCGRAAAPGSTTLALSIGGRRRTVIVHVPTGYSTTVPQALVLNLHGSGSTAAQQEGFTGMDTTADAHDFVVAYPQGAIPSGSGFDWNVPGEPLFGGAAAPAGSPDDVSFLTSLVGVLGRRYCLDASRVFATGFSGGARTASQLACDASSVFAAVAPVSGLRYPTPCPTRRPVPVLSMHGTADPVDPYLGHGQTYWTYSVPTAAARWAVRDRCAARAVVTVPVAGVTLTHYLRCAAGSTVELYTLAGEGHEWPDGPKLPRSLTRALGPQTTAVDADQVIWAFLAAHPLPAGR